MAKANTKEVAVIDFEKFSVAQLPELQGKKEEIKSVIEANPVVEIVDNSTYELAKKSRTAVRSLRTSLENEQKTVKKKIKEHVLDVVDKEYDTLVLGVRNQEMIRQEPITAWEEKKEQERIEKARLEQERIDFIKSRISIFFMDWSAKIGSLQFADLENFATEFTNSIEDYNRETLQEFEVLFDDAISNLTYMFSEKKANLVAQEQIRLDNLIIQEKNAENNKISKFSNEWNSNIESLKISDIHEVKEVFKRSKIMGLKHFQSNFDELYTSTEKRLNSQIELISKAEEQRIAQEKFQKEKAEFEAKQLEAKYQERKKFLVDEDYWRIYLLAECGEREYVAKAKLSNFSDSDFEDFKLAVIKSKELVVAIDNHKTDEIAQEQIREFDEEDVHEVATAKPLHKEEKILNENPDILNWQNINAVWMKYYTQTHALIEYLEEFYNVPTKKQ